MQHAITISDPPFSTDLTSAIRRARADFIEMPGLQVTLAQATRLWGLDAGVCSAVLALLVDARFLVRTGKDRYSRP